MMKSAKLKATATMMLGAIVAAAPRIANACATCGLSEGDHAASAYKDSVLFMMASPYVLFGHDRRGYLLGLSAQSQRRRIDNH